MLLREELEQQKKFTAQIETQMRAEVQDIMSLMNGDQGLMDKIDEMMVTDAEQKVTINKLKIKLKLS